MHGNRSEEEGKLRVYIDAPARCIFQPDGFLDFDAPCNVIVHRQVTDMCLPEATCRLSIRCAFQGERVFETGGGRFVVDDRSYLLLNLGQSVSSCVQADSPVECFNVTFQPGFAEQVLRSQVTSDDRLLDSPQGGSTQPIQFFSQTFPHDQTLSPQLLWLRSVLGTVPVSPGWLEEQFHFLLERLLAAHRNIYREVARVPAARPATRAEIYHRLCCARDYMEACLSQPLTLREIAEVACLSPHHFLRLFKQVFHATPHQYLTHLRLERARSLLAKTQTPITEVCLLVGFESLGSFSWLFRKRFGLSPKEFRVREGRTSSLPTVDDPLPPF
jgi:AraC-like DNA-binding protein